jgi:hypothetical protein
MANSVDADARKISVFDILDLVRVRSRDVVGRMQSGEDGSTNVW